ncbi:MAG: hypothetical protein KKE59_09265, partial [Proteobacteria bacterium]|nr:hypothetical protein [Pseudomonadota bacterium]
SAAALTMADGALINSGSGKIVLKAANNITLGGLLTTNSTADAVKITSTAGSIIDGGDTHLEVDAANGNLEMNATAGTIGSGNPLEINVATLTASSSGTLEIIESDGITLTDVRTVNGAINIRTLAGDMVATYVASGGNQAITLNSSGNIDLTTVNAGDGAVSLTSTGTLNGGTFTGGSGTINASTAGLTSPVTANVSTLTSTLTAKDAAGVSAKIKGGSKLTVVPNKENIKAPGTFIIQGMTTYLASELEGIEGALASLATLSAQQEVLEILMRAASEAQFFNIPPLELFIDMEEEKELDVRPDELEGGASLLSPGSLGATHGMDRPSLLPDIKVEVSPRLSYFPNWMPKQKPSIQVKTLGSAEIKSLDSIL